MHGQFWDRMKPIQSLLMMIITLGYLLGTHLSTINSLKMALASKADRAELEFLDKKLTRIEVKLEEAVMTKKDVYEWRRYFDDKLAVMGSRLESMSERNGHDGR